MPNSALTEEQGLYYVYVKLHADHEHEHEAHEHEHENHNHEAHEHETHNHEGHNHEAHKHEGEEGIFEKREVKIGQTDGSRTEIVGGLKAGETVVSKGAYQVKLAASSSVIPEGHNHNH